MILAASNLLEELLSINPKARALLCSGYLDEKLHLEQIQTKGIHFLQKPYSMNELLSAIRAMFEKK